MTYPPQPQAFGHPAHPAPLPQATPAAPGAPTAPTTPSASAPMRVVEARGLTKVYGEGEARVVALDSASLVVGRGEFVAIMGPSGSGKSTLLHCLSGMDQPDTGSVLLGGQEITEDVPDGVKVFSPDAPLGQALMGHRAGDTVSYEAPNGRKIQAEIVKVERV